MTFKCPKSQPNWTSMEDFDVMCKVNYRHQNKNWRNIFLKNDV